MIITSDANIALVGGTTRLSDTAYRMLRVRDPSVLLSATRDFVFPTSPAGLWVVHNLTAQTLNVSASGGTETTAVATGVAAEFFGDGTDMVLLGDSSSGSGSITANDYYSLKFSFMGQPDPLIECMRMISVRALRFPAGATNSAATAAIVATADAPFKLYVDDTVVATITFPAATATAVFSNTVTKVLVPGSVVSLRAPPVKDTTLNSMGFAFAFLKG